MRAYIERIVDRELDELFDALPAIALEGARAIGKTETAMRRARTTYLLDREAQRAVAEAEPQQVTSGEMPILVDEWQRVPPTWDAVRRAVDRDREPGQFLLTGSASPAAPPTHSGAGRIVTLRMRPLTLTERGVGTPATSLRELLSGRREPVGGDSEVMLADYVAEIVASGFPAIRSLPDRARRAQLDSYLHRVVDRDFERQGLSPRAPEALRRWMAAYAAATSTTTSLAKIRDAATGRQGETLSKPTIQAYREILEQLWILEPVPAWIPARNYLSRLSQPPKHHLVDPALAARLLGVDANALLHGNEGTSRLPRDGTLLGHLYESLITLSVRVFAQAAEARVLHLRLYSGAREIDLIVERADRRVVAIEVKLSATVRDEDVKNLLWLREKIGDDVLDSVVINTGPRAYRRKDGIAVIPGALLGP